MSTQTHPHHEALPITAAGHAALDRVAAHLAAAIDTSTPQSIANGAGS